MSDASGSQIRDGQDSLPDRDAAIADEQENGGTGPFAVAAQATRMPMVISNPRLPDNPIIFANDAFCRLTGYDAQEVIGRNCRFLQGPMTDARDVDRIRDAIRDAEPLEIELRNHRKDGTPFWNRLFLDPIRDADGDLAYFFASQMEVTLERETIPGLQTDNTGLATELARRLMAQEDSEARLRFATKAGRLGIWELDLVTQELTASALFRDSFGRAHDAPFTFAEMQDAVHPADRARVRAAMDRCITAGADFDVEFRAVHGGGVNWVQVRAQGVRAADGAMQRMAGISLDVTARHDAERRLELSEESRRLATEAAEVGTWDLDVLTGDLTWSERTCAIFGVPPDAPCSIKSFHDQVHPEDRATTAAAFEAALDPARRAPYDVEYRVIGVDRVVRWVAVRGRGVFEDGRCARALGTAVDITERRAAERQRAFLSELLDRIRTLAEPHEIMDVAVQALGRHVGADRVGYGDIQDDADTALIRTCRAETVAPLLGAYRISAFGHKLAAQLRDGVTVACRDVLADPAFDGAAWEAVETRSFVCVPLVRGGQFRATMFVNWRDAQALPADDIAAIEDVAARTWDAVERARAEAALREANEARMRSVFQTSYQLQALLALDGTVLDANATALQDINAQLEDVVGRPFWDTPWFNTTPGLPDMTQAAVAAAARGETRRMEMTINRRGGVRSYDFSVRPILDAGGAVVGIVPEAVDITERRQTEEALRQSQKMEAVGQLTGGIAHDFNNLLAGITGGLEMVQRRVASGRTDGLEQFTAAAIVSAQRAASLTQRLLAFARRQPLDPRRVEADVLLAGMEDLLRRTLGPSIALQVMPGDGLWPTLCDPNQLEAAVLNLAINARDAMPDGGRLRVETANAHLDEAGASGRYVCVSVTDTGAGMTPDVLARAFDPFFTTKPIGQGTGLGLSMLYGFVKQSDGHVRVASSPGLGTTFRLYLPRYHGDTPADANGAAPANLTASAGGTVLVVEDEATVRMLVVETLRELGYAVLQAVDGAEGLRMLRGGKPVDLLLTDVGMPGLNGRQLADAARALQPGLPVLFMTGYAHGAVGGGDALDAGMEILAKPFELDILGQKVRAMLEA